MKNISLLIGTIVGTFALIGIVVFFLSSNQPVQTGSVVELSKLTAGAANIKRTNTMTSDITAETTAEATAAAASESQSQITIVEFSDFQCPACKAAQPLVDQVLTQYSDSVQLVYRHFPLDSIHPNARLAAVAAEAASALEKEKFWDYHDLLFANQQEWSVISSRDELKETFATYATEIGLDKTQFLEKMEDTTLTQLVAQDASLGTEIGVNSTPTFFVNGVQTSVTGLAAAVQTQLSQGE